VLKKLFINYLGKKMSEKKRKASKLEYVKIAAA